MALSNAQRQEFFLQGVTQLAGAFSESDAARMTDRIWCFLESKHKIKRGDQATWTEKQPTGFQSLTREGVFRSIESPQLIDALNDLLGPGSWTSGNTRGVPLVTFPEPKRKWDVPERQWHLDFPAQGGVAPLGVVRVLAFLARVESAAGGTVVAAGSHRLVERVVAAGKALGGHSATVRDLLGSSDVWLRDLWSRERGAEDRVRRFMTDGTCIDGVDVRVKELTGAPGDVVLMHPWTFHAPAPNCGSSPRMMVSYSAYRT